MTEQTAAEVRTTLADAARQARGVVLAELADPESELAATPGARNRLEGAALDAVAASVPMAPPTGERRLIGEGSAGMLGASAAHRLATQG